MVVVDKAKLEPSLLARKQKLNESRYLLQRPLNRTSDSWCSMMLGGAHSLLDFNDRNFSFLEKRTN